MIMEKIKIYEDNFGEINELARIHGISIEDMVDELLNAYRDFSKVLNSSGYTYYSPLRPITVGCFPKPKNNTVLEIYNFDERSHIHGCDRPVWGYIIYEKELTEQAAYEYDLVKGADNE